MKLLEAIKVCAEHEGFGVKKKTLEGYNKDRLYFCMFARNPELEDIQEGDVINFFKMMLELGWDQNSVMHKSIALRNLFSYWIKRGRRCLNPELIPIPKREFKMPDVAEHWQYERFLATIPRLTNDKRWPRLRALAMLLYDTGARGGEILMLNVKDLDFSDPTQGRAVIKTEKSRGMRPIREIFWTPNTTIALKEWLKARQEMIDRGVKFADPDALFVGVRCWQAGKRLAVGALDIAFRKHCRDIGLAPLLHPHMLRHLKGHDLNSSGANNTTISGILGHASLASSQIYTQMRSHELKAAAMKYARKRG